MADLESSYSAAMRPVPLRRPPLPRIQMKPPAHLRCIAQWLCRLPSEILLYYPVLEEVPISQILLMTGSLKDSAKLDRCIIGQKEYKDVFPSMEQLANLRDTFLFLHVLRAIKGFTATLTISSPFGCTAKELANYHPPNFRALQIYANKALRRLLTDQKIACENCPGNLDPSMENLRDCLRLDYSQDWDAQIKDTMNFSRAQLKEIFESARGKDILFYFKPPKKSLKMLRKEQFALMADLIETYPEILKRASDPQPNPSPNWRHVMKLLTNHSSRVQNHLPRRWTTYSHPASQGPFLFRFDMLPIVPSDKSLALFVAGVAKVLPLLPKELAEIIAPEVLKDVPCRPELVPNASSSTRLFATPFARFCLEIDNSLYPPTILQDIKTAVKGMAYVYLSPHGAATEPQPKVLRTRWTPWSAERYRTALPLPHPLDSKEPSSNPSHLMTQNPVFLSLPYDHLDILPPVKLDKYNIRFYIPTSREVYPLKEFEWLTTFCRMVRFFERMEQGCNPSYDEALKQQARFDDDLLLEMTRESRVRLRWGFL